MFKFNFELDDVDETDNTAIEGFSSQAEPSPSQIAGGTVVHKDFTEHSLVDLIAQLPPDISYSPLTIKYPGSASSVTIARRDLFDARYQLIASGTAGGPIGPGSTGQDDLDFVEAPSDLVPGVYEGGLKTWECSIDLAAILRALLPPASELKSRRLLELGCGTAVPSLYVLKTIFESQADPDRNISIHLQDYNDLVFRLVTLPNIILAWYMSPASASFQSEITSQAYAEAKDEDAEVEADTFPPPNASEPGELPFTPALISAFRKSLREYGIELRFFSGSWGSFESHATGARYHIVLTSETIYRTDSLPSLLDLMWTSCTGGSSKADQTLEQLTQDRLKLKESKNEDDYICLVAAKLVYFGVGGGVREFMQAVESGVPSNVARGKGSVEILWSSEDGVKRNVMKVNWRQ